MSGHQEYKCPKCGYEYESLEPFDCPRCRELAAPPLLGVDKRNTKMTVADILKQIPQRWRNAEVAVGDSIGRGLPVRRVALHRDSSGRQVVVLYDDPIEVKASA